MARIVQAIDARRQRRSTQCGPVSRSVAPAARNAARGMNRAASAPMRRAQG
jgi:hypothetical protein